MSSSDDDRIDDDEIVYRLIQPGTHWFEPPDRIKSSSFKLRPGEMGISVFRAAFVSPADVRRILHATNSYPVAECRVGDIRRAVKGDQSALNLSVIVVDRGPEEPGHAEIRGDMTAAASKALSRLFKLVPQS